MAVLTQEQIPQDLLEGSSFLSRSLPLQPFETEMKTLQLCIYLFTYLACMQVSSSSLHWNGNRPGKWITESLVRAASRKVNSLRIAPGPGATGIVLRHPAKKISHLTCGCIPAYIKACMWHTKAWRMDFVLFSFHSFILFLLEVLEWVAQSEINFSLFLFLCHLFLLSLSVLRGMQQWLQSKCFI